MVGNDKHRIAVAMKMGYHELQQEDILCLDVSILIQVQ